MVSRNSLQSNCLYVDIFILLGQGVGDRYIESLAQAEVPKMTYDRSAASSAVEEVLRQHTKYRGGHQGKTPRRNTIFKHHIKERDRKANRNMSSIRVMNKLIRPIALFLESIMIVFRRRFGDGPYANHHDGHLIPPTFHIQSSPFPFQDIRIRFLLGIYLHYLQFEELPKQQFTKYNKKEE